MTHGRRSEGETGEWSGEPVPFTLPRNMRYPALLPLMRTPRLPVIDWTDAPRRFKWTRPFRRKTNSGFCTCAITFQLASTTFRVLSVNILMTPHASVPGERSRYRSWIRAGRYGDRIPVQKRFTAPFQTGPGAHPVSYKLYLVSFPGVKRPVRGVGHPPPTSAKVK